MSALFICMTDLVHCTKEDVYQVFMKKRQYVKGCYPRHYFDEDDIVQDEDKAFIDVGAHKSMYLREISPSFTLVKVERNFGQRKNHLKKSLFP